jgi:hypothetical protein
LEAAFTSAVQLFQGATSQGASTNIQSVVFSFGLGHGHAFDACNAVSRQPAVLFDPYRFGLSLPAH